MKYIMFYDDWKGGGTLSRHRQFEADDDSVALVAAHQWIADNNEKGGYRTLTLTSLERAWGAQLQHRVSVPIK